MRFRTDGIVLVANDDESVAFFAGAGHGSSRVIERRLAATRYLAAATATQEQRTNRNVRALHFDRRRQCSSRTRRRLLRVGRIAR